MTSIEIFFLIFLNIPFGILIFALWSFYKKVKYDNNRYRFFAIRDRLVRLVAEGYLREDEFVFEEFYKIINKIVNRTETFKFRNLVQIISAIDANKLEKQQFQKKIFREIQSKDVEVQKVIIDLFRTIIVTFYDNSWGLRILISWTSLWFLMKKAKRIIEKLHIRLIEQIIYPWTEACRLYQLSSNLIDRLEEKIVVI